MLLLPPVKYKKAILTLQDDFTVQGDGFGKIGTYTGELVFTTGMTGYVESLTDPSYAGQILTFSYPLIGNYGVNPKWYESSKVHPKAIVVSELCDYPVHRDSKSTLHDFLLKQQIGGIKGIDTRALIRTIRRLGVVPSVLTVYEQKEDEDLIQKVTTKKLIKLNLSGSPCIVLIDYGFKHHISYELTKRGAKVIILPAHSSAKEVLRYKPSAIVLSNGPGDPSDFKIEIKTISDLLCINTPIFGICLGHQLLALAAGARTYKLPFGHRGINHPVLNVKTKKSFITSQNHGYAVDASSLNSDWEVSFINLNDGTVEGLKHKKLPFSSIQFHPEAHPGPRDTTLLLDNFLKKL